jgi:hypothetical protein
MPYLVSSSTAADDYNGFELDIILNKLASSKLLKLSCSALQLSSSFISIGDGIK